MSNDTMKRIELARRALNSAIQYNSPWAIKYWQGIIRKLKRGLH